ncbi:hypothetical protein HK097_005754 [Rhizophlyctis rosea]|uniref:Coatomer subunit epsilon n=1 Tax=Rhizophlyctis rosea TaxID=64517 RepID=A0AAD5X9R8_9FUNG|nr:hypothetical protein HK097_005754 [Rhizophlyctis rosea]
MADVDELLLLRNLFYLGSYQQVINEATNPSTTPRSDIAKLERRVFLHRAQIAQGRYNLVTSEISDSDPAELRAVKILARYVQASNGGKATGKETAVTEIQALVDEGANGLSSLVQLIAGTIYYGEGAYDEALRAVVQSPKQLECVALLVQTYLKLNRPDLAQKEVEKLKTWADDATLAQLVEAWVNLYSGGTTGKAQEAYYIFEELASSKVATSKLLTGQSVSRMQEGRFSDAEELLLESLNKNPNDAETLANLAICASATGKPSEVANRYINQLKDVSPSHPFVEELQLKESLFDRTAQRFTA